MVGALLPGPLMSLGGMRHWLFKEEPSSYDWRRLVADGRTWWDGVENALARKHLKSVYEDYRQNNNMQKTNGGSSHKKNPDVRFFGNFSD